ncbi:hypothetical protein C806_00641 [Lachnospiraceae bacterium 3-1]|nr:hypothetical protein C806_00641 [Lachnospiraceae bacterium 3-1]
MDILLIVTLVILGVFGLHGYIRGMVRMIFSLAAVLVTIVLASLTAPYVAEFLRMQTPLHGVIHEKCTEVVQNNIGIHLEGGIEQVADWAVQRIAWIAAFLLISILLGILIHVLDIIAKLPVIESINHMGGLVVGLLEGLLVIWILFFVIALCQGSQWGNQMMQEIQENPLLQWLYQNNILERFL